MLSLLKTPQVYLQKRVIDPSANAHNNLLWAHWALLTGMAPPHLIPNRSAMPHAQQNGEMWCYLGRAARLTRTPRGENRSLQILTVSLTKRKKSVARQEVS